MRRTLALVGIGAIAALSACTPQELAGWMDWNAKDPAAAQAFAMQPEIQASLATGEHEQQAPAPTSNWSVNWDRVANCESGGNWGHGIVRNRYGSFSGGLMIMVSAWRQFGGQEFADHAGNATKAQQIIVAERIVDRVGFDDAWQCHG